MGNLERRKAIAAELRKVGKARPSVVNRRARSTAARGVPTALLEEAVPAVAIPRAAVLFMGAIDHGAFSGLEHLPLRSLVERLRKEARPGWRVNLLQAVCNHFLQAYAGRGLSMNQAYPIIADLIEADLKEEAGKQPAAGAQVENPLQVEPPRPPAPPIRQPRPKQVQAFWLAQAGKAQQQIAELLSTSQGTVSKWIKHVKRWRDAGNKMPEIPRTEPLDSKPTAMDPAKLDLGPRPDHRPEGQQAKLAEISGHGSQDE